MLRLLLLFTVVPAVELFLLLQLGSLIGPLWTFVIVVVTGTIGAWLAKREGLGLLSTLSEELNNGIPPGNRLMEGVLVVVGGILLITPGVFTDITGFLLIAPPSRRFLAPRVLSYLASRFQITGSVGHQGVRQSRPSPDGTAPTPFANPFDDLE